MSTETLREDMTDFSSIICLKAIITGLEKIMGAQAARGNLIRAGIIRGREIAKKLGISQTDAPIEQWISLAREAVGRSGTRLCDIKNTEEENGTIRIFLKDTICSAGEELGSSRELSFTQGAIQGLAEEALGKRFVSKQIGSVLRGQEYDIVELTPR